MIIDTSPSNVLALQERIKTLEERQQIAIQSLEQLANDLAYSEGEIQIWAADLTGIVELLTTGEWPK